MSQPHRAPWECVLAKEEPGHCLPGKMPRRDQQNFEILCLCLLQAGLNWGSIRAHWGRYREGFLGFDIDRLAAARVETLLGDARIIRNARKVQAVIDNAQIFRQLARDHGSFSAWLRTLRPLTDEQVVAALGKRFHHVGEYTADYFLHSIGYRK